MQDIELQHVLLNVIDALFDARDEFDGEDDDITLADFARDASDAAQGLTSIVTYESVQMLTNNAGLVIGTDDGSEFRLTITKAR